MSRRSQTLMDDEKRDMCLSCTLPASACDNEAVCPFIIKYGKRAGIACLRQEVCGVPDQPLFGLYEFTGMGKQKKAKRANGPG